MNRASLATCEEQNLDEGGFAFRRKRLCDSTSESLAATQHQRGLSCKA